MPRASRARGVLPATSFPPPAARARPSPAHRAVRCRAARLRAPERVWPLDVALPLPRLRSPCAPSAGRPRSSGGRAPQSPARDGSLPARALPRLADARRAVRRGAARGGSVRAPPVHVCPRGPPAARRAARAVRCGGEPESCRSRRRASRPAGRPWPEARAVAGAFAPPPRGSAPCRPGSRPAPASARRDGAAA